jgi:glycosyltransferase involved in cell wall biosynthesis
MQLTVAICTHNPRPHYLERVLAGLRAQTLTVEKWELLLIDNASTTPPTVDISWHPNGRILHEATLGVSYARARAIQESATEIIMYVDDDNVLAPDYLSEAVRIAHEFPLLGVWGAGMILPEYEMRPASDLTELLSYLALRDDPRTYWANLYPIKAATPWGAGFCIRKKVAQVYHRMSVDSEIVITSRQGRRLVTGEDNEMTYTACELGLGSGVFPQLKLTHLIPRERVTRKYLLRLYEGTELSIALIHYKWLGERPRSSLSPRAIMSLIKNCLLSNSLRRAMHFAKRRGLNEAARIINKTRPSEPLRWTVATRYLYAGLI